MMCCGGETQPHLQIDSVLHWGGGEHSTGLIQPLIVHSSVSSVRGSTRCDWLLYDWHSTAQWRRPQLSMQKSSSHQVVWVIHLLKQPLYYFHSLLHLPFHHLVLILQPPRPFIPEICPPHRAVFLGADVFLGGAAITRVLATPVIHAGAIPSPQPGGSDDGRQDSIQHATTPYSDTCHSAAQHSQLRAKCQGFLSACVQVLQLDSNTINANQFLA